MTAKEEILALLEQLPDNASIEDAIYELYVAFKIERGLQQADRGEGIPHEEAKQRFAQWLK